MICKTKPSSFSSTSSSSFGFALLFLVHYTCLTAPAASNRLSLQWSQLPPIPDRNGFAAPFAGVSGGALLVAGGANFPKGMPWDGGQKVWYDSVFVLPKPDGDWLTGFKLPRPVGYGVSITTKRGVLCAGGSDAKEHFRDVFLLRWRNGQVETETLPALPQPLANACGALLGNTVYIAGGITKPDATNALKNFWALDLSKVTPQWRELEPWPGPPRMLATAAAQAGAFYLLSGAELYGDAEGKPVRRYLKDAYRFTPRGGWKRIADLPRPAVASPSPAPALGSSQFVVLSGDDGSKVGFEPRLHPGFPKTALVYHISSWTELDGLPAPRVTVPVVSWRGQFVVPNGEMRPGVRSPEVWAGRAGR